jgi:hypothetical protein
MTYRVRMLVYFPGRSKATREIVTKFAGCLNEADARAAARKQYDVAAFKSVEPVEPVKEEQ